MLFFFGERTVFRFKATSSTSHMSNNFHQRLLDSSAPKGLNTLAQETLERSNVFGLGIDVFRHGL